MINAPYEKEFVFNDGQRAKNLLELSVVIERMGQQDFEIFVNPSKNDFANWIEYVLLDKQLASSLRSTILLNKTKELLNGKLATENASASSINNVANKYKTTLFNIFKHEPKNTVVQLHAPIEKIPEQGNKTASEHHFESKHHIIQKIPDIKSPEKTAADTQADKPADTTKNNIPRDDVLRTAPKKDNALKKWYEFKKKERELRKHTSEANKDSGNSSEDSSSRNILWILIYGALIFFIIALIVYKFVLRL